MHQPDFLRFALLVLTIATRLVVAAPPASTALSSNSTAIGTVMKQQVTGPFDVTMTPQSGDASAGGDTIGRMLLSKEYHGSLDATGKGQMLATRNLAVESGGYVALEWVVGKLDGRSGSFVLQHSGVMNRGARALTLNVVPDSGTGELVGIAGSMEIIIAEGKHSYRFAYTLPAP
jgi:hypothetical protein